MRVQVIQSHTLGGGKIAEVGDILELPDGVAIERIHYGRVIPAPFDPPEASASGVPGGAATPPSSPAGGGAEQSDRPAAADAAPPASDDPPANDLEGEGDDDDLEDEPAGRKRPGRARR
jgi:hypothetical protein